MAELQLPSGCLQLVAVFSRHGAAIDWSRDRLAECWGSICLASERFDHSETRYYEATMGPGLWKQFFITDRLFDPGHLMECKLQSNDWEQELRQMANFPEERPVNIDPGYLTLTKLVLASAKDRAHRIYLGDGIFAESCLHYMDGCWQAWPWTYSDYQRQDFQRFFSQARELLKQKIVEQQQDFL